MTRENLTIVSADSSICRMRATSAATSVAEMYSHRERHSMSSKATAVIGLAIEIPIKMLGMFVVERCLTARVVTNIRWAFTQEESDISK